jgi:hypothetical protein
MQERHYERKAEVWSMILEKTMMGIPVAAH